MTKIYVSLGPAEGKFRLNREFKKRLVKVMRLKVGDELQVISPGKQWLCKLGEIHPDECVLEILREMLTPEKPRLQLVLVQAIPKGDRFEWLIQKGTELGITEIFPIISERTIVRPKGSDKTQRWNEIAEQAAGQSENSFPPIIHEPQNLMTFVDSSSADLKLFLEERTNTRNLKELLSIRPLHRIIFVVGPEGGWSESEREQMLSKEFQAVHLGPRILRSETAGLVLATLLQYELGDFHSAGHTDPGSTTS